MQIRKEDLSLAQLNPFTRLRLLHLDDHIGSGKDFGRCVYDIGASLLIHFIRCTDPRTRALLDDHPMSGGSVFPHGSRRETNSVFVCLNLLGNTDEHFINPYVFIDVLL